MIKQILHVCPKCNAKALQYLCSNDDSNGFFRMDNCYCIRDGYMMKPEIVNDDSKPECGEIDPIERKICQDNERNHLPCSICGKGMDKPSPQSKCHCGQRWDNHNPDKCMSEPDPRTLDGHCGGCGADIVKGVMQCDCPNGINGIPLCPSAGSWGTRLENVLATYETCTGKTLKEVLSEHCHSGKDKDGGENGELHDLAVAVRAYIVDKIDLCLMANGSTTHVIAKDLLGEI